jgi:hypothetical protein
VDKVAAQAESRLREHVERGPVHWSALRQLRDEVELDVLDLIALVLRNEWRWDRAPFRLSGTHQS